MINSNLRSPLAVYAALILAVILIALTPTNANAIPEVYTYTGDFFNTFSNPSPPDPNYSTLDNVTGTFTVPSAFPASMPSLSINPTSFSFSDGRTTLTNLSPLLTSTMFTISTDTNADILLWSIFIETGAQAFVGSQAFRIATRNTSPFDEGRISEVVQTGIGGFSNTDIGSLTGRPGTWTSAPIPEPSTMLLLASGLAGLGFFRWRRKGRKNPSIV